MLYVVITKGHQSYEGVTKDTLWRQEQKPSMNAYGKTHIGEDPTYECICADFEKALFKCHKGSISSMQATSRVSYGKAIYGLRVVGYPT